ncbi:MAG: dTDP-6-deoxy-3,4-keto-hexulose isomerase [Candidatus Riflebacteria bacterium HGW-Riflebacteria-1]|jgi:dTDP-4-dehydrorhamnose 3,5-epimerase-like enzyme|nr:MAG: dTDP-6-deoxy-3,4-keto-hexulose isomerase [Candidatus Riflebacteria bacterium HGW-Riflebacteria-1]
MEYKFYDLQIKGDERGSLTVVEGNKDIPFEIKRVYYIFDTKMDVRRGFHAHKDLEQIAICVSGSCKFHLDNGHKTAEVLLDSPSKGLYVGKMVWREMYDFTPDCVLMVLASEHYDGNDYIRDYQAFQECVQNV